MILWFLNLFPRYRYLQLALDTSTASLREAREEMQIWQARAELAENGMEKANKDHTVTLKRLANYQAIQAGAVQIPFPDVHIDLSKEEEGPVALPKQPERKQMREIQQQRVAQSRRLAAEVSKKILQAQAERAVDPLGLNNI